jgi:predicted dehydrogenase
MLAAADYDIVDVSSPYRHHREHVEAALAAGSHVLCEKPLAWDDGKQRGAIVEDGRAMVDAARAAGRLLGVSAQYAAAVPAYTELYEQARGPLERIESLTMEMEVVARRSAKTYDEIWVDRASHPLSLVIAFLPDGKVDLDSAECVIAERENRAAFDVAHGGGCCRVSIVMRDIDEGEPVRRFGVNGYLVGWRGFPDASGIYRGSLVHDGGEAVGNDFLHRLIERFVGAVKGDGGAPAVTGEEGLRNLELQASLLDIAVREAGSRG